MPRITATVNVELNKTQGKFVSKDDLAEAVKAALEGADEGSWSVEDSEYETAEWDVEVT